jgi:magnesium-transporting ATPase (P-type)
LIAVAFLNAFIEFYQLQKSEAILASFLAMIPPSCRVVRDGTIATIAASDLVKGDVVLLVCVTSHCINLSHTPTFPACRGQDTR